MVERGGFLASAGAFEETAIGLQHPRGHRGASHRLQIIGGGHLGIAQEFVQQRGMERRQIFGSLLGTKCRQIILYRGGVMLARRRPGIEQRQGQKCEWSLGRLRQIFPRPGIILLLQVNYGQCQPRGAVIGIGGDDLLGIFARGVHVTGGAGIEERQRQEAGIGRIVGQAPAVIGRCLVQIMLAGGKTRRQISGESLRLLGVCRALRRRHCRLSRHWHVGAPGQKTRDEQK